MAKTIRIVRLPGLPEKGDVSDWLDADSGNADKLVDYCFDAPLWTPETAAPSIVPDAPAVTLPIKLALSSAEFVAGFTPPDYLVVGWLQRRFVYSLTAATGDGKTAVALLITLLISKGFKLGKLDFKCGRVLYFAGENPDDVRMRSLISVNLNTPGTKYTLSISSGASPNCCVVAIHRSPRRRGSGASLDLREPALAFPRARTGVGLVHEIG